MSTPWAGLFLSIVAPEPLTSRLLMTHRAIPWEALKRVVQLPRIDGDLCAGRVHGCPPSDR